MSWNYVNGFLRKLYSHLVSDNNYKLSGKYYPYLNVRVSAVKDHDIPVVKVDNHNEDKEGGANVKETGLLLRHEHADFYPNRFFEDRVNTVSLRNHTFFFNATIERTLYNKDETLPAGNFFSEKDKTTWEHSISISIKIGLFQAFRKPTTQIPKSNVVVTRTEEAVTMPTMELQKTFTEVFPIIKGLLR